MKKLTCAAVLLFALFAGACPTLAQTTQTQPFSSFVLGLPAISSLAGTEKILTLQGGVPMTSTPEQILSAANGDCAFNPSSVCTKTSGLPFAPSATTDTTNAANITSGTLSANRLALQTAYFYVGNASNNPVGTPMSGDCTLASTGAVTCTETRGVAFAPSATTDTTNAGNISSGTLNLSRLSLLQAQFYVGNASNNPASVLMSGDCGLAYTGAVTCPTSNGYATATLNKPDQTVSGGANVTTLILTAGSSPTIDCGARPLQSIIASASAWTIYPPSSDGSCMLMVINNATSGSPAPTFASGFYVGSNTGDAIPTGAGAVYIISIVRITGPTGAASTYSIKVI
ncbi:hypothetical protein [Bradyrhizobium erythrophlei]|uniref:Uncharacterized protein n=1 Tax=Bradyrhizobium erythrophlei TaxID=1437360 RepID=A0A1M5NS48_9BRAD|nr:hypothetical protein [Bradyrhizobium erythrophlei]SHG92298.1 hypothetical protein SAMN05443248_3095 [Bradyrhizobium erythrophlei]